MKEINLNCFPKVSKDEWIDLARKQLKSDEALEGLNWLTDHSIPVGPYYDDSDLEGLETQIGFFNTLTPFRWKLYEEIEVDNDADANLGALKALTGGCDGIIFKADKPVSVDILLKDIVRDICDLSIISKNAVQATEHFSGFVINQNNSNALSANAAGSQIDQLVNIVKNLEDETHILRDSDPDFFLEISSIRALRILLSRYQDKDPWMFSIHTRVPFHSDPEYQWFFNASSGLASILGGTTSISFSTAQGNSRISRNTGNLIREESGITEYTDQCGGAYYVEALTGKIVRECEEQLKGYEK